MKSEASHATEKLLLLLPLLPMRRLVALSSPRYFIHRIHLPISSSFERPLLLLLLLINHNSLTGSWRRIMSSGSCCLLICVCRNFFIPAESGAGCVDAVGLFSWRQLAHKERRADETRDGGLTRTSLISQSAGQPRGEATSASGLLKTAAVKKSATLSREEAQTVAGSYRLYLPSRRRFG